ncbi:hypothetical protein [Rufibacter roseolus]|uniref:hypothetical protein n=1 Tax=Rufibacter roseolus TaxID=2817375 RepID=UPI001B30674B|nr:hypothetical protein [Rufibacter roseolus]
MLYILDACTIINLLHIDEDEYLLKKISSFEFHICKDVFDEVNKNVFKKFNSIIPYPSDKHSIIEYKLNYFREKIYFDESFNDLESDIGELLDYKKRNGEFYCALLSFYLNIFSKSHIVLFTDDGPAKEFFSPHFLHHRVGYIEDTVDLLIHLYRHNDDFSSNDLKKFLSNLYFEYSSELSSLQNDLESFEIPKDQIRNSDLRNKLGQLRNAIQRLDIEFLSKAYQEVMANGKKFSSLYGVLDKYNFFFYKRPNTALFNKVKSNRGFVDSKPFYRF